MTAFRDPMAFIRAETAVRPVPHAPEIRLHVADEAMDLWQKTEEELEALGLPPPFWAFAWAGGQALARYILDHPDLVQGRSVLDLASGSGLVGIAAMKSGASVCRSVDIDAFAAHAARANAELNGVELTIETRDITDGPAPEERVLFCGDVFYEKPMAGKMLAFADRALAAGIAVYVGDPGRSYLPRVRLEHLATYDIQVIANLEDAEIKRTSVYRLLPPSAAPKT
ncbi:class I SAM-dependent methyltransferase [Roseibium aestuarii]|uniref:Class I SAM-dependent methyltransferase n=1 Tax=Roseibium aestuarii TaxID=2600299 RepID=A0ABW4JXL0_9HYPH|nr:50S ribosomal protein L11 methyltransferase [Roseibium aestuarii]